MHSMGMRTFNLVPASSGVSVYSETFDISHGFGASENLGFMGNINGDLGVTGASISVWWETRFTSDSGVSWAIGTTKLIASGTTKTSNVTPPGCNLTSFAPRMPWIRIGAIADAVATTTTAGVSCAVAQF